MHTHPKNLSISDFNYQLPDERIASYPLKERDLSNLLVYQNGSIADDIYQNIASHIPAGSLLVFNNTKVVEARLLFQKSTGGVIEIFCLEPDEQYADITTAMQQNGRVFWQCLVGGASKWKPGQILQKIIYAYNKEVILQAAYIKKRVDSFIIELSWSDPAMSFAELMHHAGAIPLPPYIKRKAEQSDSERYQTVYARYDGSVAAPTAGLHFTDTIFKHLEEKNIKKEFITLHVGAGTFKPVKTDTMVRHEMHAEFIEVSVETIQQLIDSVDKKIIPVGTTSMRTIESLYWLGVKLSTADSQQSTIIPELNQWEAYDLPQNISPKTALQTLLDWLKKNQLLKLITRTRIIIAPGYQLRISKGLVTNFHQPQSTLLLLIAAVVGDDWRKIYDHALENNYRFLSYGDGCLLFPRF